MIGSGKGLSCKNRLLPSKQKSCPTITSRTTYIIWRSISSFFVCAFFVKCPCFGPWKTLEHHLKEGLNVCYSSIFLMFLEGNMCQLLWAFHVSRERSKTASLSAPRPQGTGFFEHSRSARNGGRQLLWAFPVRKECLKNGFTCPGWDCEIIYEHLWMFLL